MDQQNKNTNQKLNEEHLALFSELQKSAGSQILPEEVRLLIQTLKARVSAVEYAVMVGAGGLDSFLVIADSACGRLLTFRGPDW